jgi:hypothetical protein
MRPHSIFRMTDAFEATDSFAFLGIDINHALPVAQVFSSLATLAAGISQMAQELLLLVGVRLMLHLLLPASKLHSM